MASDAEILTIAKDIRQKRKVARNKRLALGVAESALADAEALLQEEE